MRVSYWRLCVFLLRHIRAAEHWSLEARKITEEQVVKGTHWAAYISRDIVEMPRERGQESPEHAEAPPWLATTPTTPSVMNPPVFGQPKAPPSRVPLWQQANLRWEDEAPAVEQGRQAKQGQKDKAMTAEEISLKKKVAAHQQSMANPSMTAAALRAGNLAGQEVEAQTLSPNPAQHDRRCADERGTPRGRSEEQQCKGCRGGSRYA